MKTEPTIAFLSLGSNRGNRLHSISQAISAVSELPKTTLLRVSSAYQTAAVGGPKQPDFINAVLKIKTQLQPPALLKKLKQIERSLGRSTGRRWGPRIIDLDIILFDGRVMRTKTLTIPHPRYAQRRFVLIPLAELSPRLKHPILDLTTTQLLRELTPHGQRVTMNALWKKSRFTPFKSGKKKKSPSQR